MQLFITAIFGLVLFFDVAASCPTLCSCTTNSEGSYVDCRSKGLDSMPSDLPNNTYEFHLEGNKITAILPETFTDLPNLISIHLESNLISAIENNAFNNLPGLTNLRLDHNKISVIEDNAFNNLTSLYN